MEFRQLKYFIQIAKDQNYTTASKKLYITQPTLSWTIKQLEEELGAKLFDHSGKKLSLTHAGEELLHHANYLLHEQQRIIELFQADNGILKGHIKLGVPEMFATCFFMETIMSFMDSYANVKVTMVNKGSIAVQEMTESEELDLGIVSYVYPSSTLDVIELPKITYPVMLIVSNHHPLANKSSVTFSDLKNESFILLTEDFTLGKLPVQDCIDAGFTPKVVLRSSEWDIICEAIANSNNVSVLPYPLVSKSKNSHITLIPIDHPGANIPIGLITKKIGINHWP